jgi:regulatory protein SWI6
MSIRCATYAGIRIYEFSVKGVSVMRRARDSYVNATQVLRAAGMLKPQRTKVLEKYVLSGKHDKVQGGFAGFQGTWVPLDQAIEFAKEYEVLDDLMPLFEYDISSGQAERKSPVPKGKRSYSAVQLNESSSDGNVNIDLGETDKSAKIFSKIAKRLTEDPDPTPPAKMERVPRMRRYAQLTQCARSCSRDGRSR